MNPFLSTPEATAFWREQDQACAEARRLLVKTPEFAQFLAAGGTIAVVPDGFPVSDNFVALLKDGDTVYASIVFNVMSWELYLPSYSAEQITRLTAWLLEARDGSTLNQPKP